ncbi:MAG: hypothetical protein ACYCX5_09925 [Coriobacteriia bacterium]
MRRIALFSAVLVLTVVLLSACAPGPNTAASEGADVAGFWQGLWHGLIVIFTFVISLFKDNVSIYEVNNNGGWYNFGYLLGVMMVFGGGGGGAASRSR